MRDAFVLLAAREKLKIREIRTNNFFYLLPQPEPAGVGGGWGGLGVLVFRRGALRCGTCLGYSDSGLETKLYFKLKVSVIYSGSTRAAQTAIKSPRLLWKSCFTKIRTSRPSARSFHLEMDTNCLIVLPAEQRQAVPIHQNSKAGPE